MDVRLPARAALLLLTALLPRIAAADQTDTRLPALFAQLHEAANAAEAAPVEAQIWAIWSDSGSAEADDLMAAGAAALVEQDGDKALEAFTKVTALLPNFAEGWNKRATTLYLLGRFAESQADIAKVLALEPRHFGALSGLGLCALQQDRLDLAAEAFKRALAVDPAMPGAQLNLKAIEEKLKKRSI